MSISEATLFVASNSKASVPCIQFVSSHGIPVQIVRLDSIEARTVAANGKYFQITSVPTMVIMYQDGNTQLFLGAPKITQWLTSMLKSSAKERHVGPQNMYGPVSTAHPLGKARRPVIDTGDDMPIPIGEDEGDDEDYANLDEPPSPPRRTPKKSPVIIEEDDPEDEPEEAPRPPPKARKGKGKAPVLKGRAKGKSRRKQVAEEEEEDEDDPMVVRRRMAKEKLNRAAAAKSKPLSSRMKDVYSMAKQMEEERLGSLGYKEEDLPHY